MSHGFFSVPRSLINDECFHKLSSKHFRIFFIILSRVSFKKHMYDDHGKMIEILPGQLCTTIREILSWCGSDISKWDVESCVKKLIRLQILGQEVRHTKSILTITHKETYELIIRNFQTGIQTTSRQLPDRNEETNNGNNLKQESIIDTEKPKNEKILKFDDPVSNFDRPILFDEFLNCESPSEQFINLSLYCSKFELLINDDTIGIWLKKWPHIYIKEHIDILTKQKDILNPESWMEKALKENFVQINKNIAENRNYATQFLKKFNHLRMQATKAYVKNLDNGNTYEFKWNHQTFKDAIITAAEIQVAKQEAERLKFAF